MGDTGDLTEAVKAAAKAPACPDPERDPEGFLKAHGWAKAPRKERPGEMLLWRDPRGTGAEEVVQVGERTLPTGKVQKIVQTHCAPVPWYYTQGEAVRLQRDRGEATQNAVRK